MSIQPVLEVGTSSHVACLKDLCSQDKKKVSNLIKQVVELKQERVVLQQQLQQALDGQAGVKDKLAGLTDSNRDLVRENGSLKAKLVNAVTLLRIYQHKVQVLEASLAHVHSGHHAAAAVAAAPPASQQAPAQHDSGASMPFPGTAYPALMPAQQAAAAAPPPPSPRTASPASIRSAIPSVSHGAPKHPHQPPQHASHQHEPQQHPHLQPPTLQVPPHHAAPRQPQPQPPAQHHPTSHQHTHQAQPPTPAPPPTGAPNTTPAPAATPPTSSSHPASSTDARPVQRPSFPGASPAPGTPTSPAGDCAASERSLLTDSPEGAASVRSQPSPCRSPSPAPGAWPSQRSMGAAPGDTADVSSSAATQRDLLALAQVISNIAKTINPASSHVPLADLQQRLQQQHLQHQPHHQHQQLHPQRPSTAATSSFSASASWQPAPLEAHCGRSSAGSSQGHAAGAAVGGQLHAFRAGRPVGAEHSMGDVALGIDQDMHLHTSSGTARKLDLAAGSTGTSTSSRSSVHDASFWNGDASMQQGNQGWTVTRSPQAAPGNAVDSLAELIYEMEELDQEPWCGSVRSSRLAKQMGPSLLNLELVEENDVLAIIAAQEGVFSFT